jgi:hypothetical protein
MVTCRSSLPAQCFGDGFCQSPISVDHQQQELAADAVEAQEEARRKEANRRASGDFHLPNRRCPPQQGAKPTGTPSQHSAETRLAALKLFSVSGVPFSGLSGFATLVCRNVAADKDRM